MCIRDRSLADTSAILGQLANQNIRAETAGVGLKNILLKVNQEGSELSQILGGNVTSFDDLVDRLQTAEADTGKFKRAQKLLGTENAVVWSSLVSGSKELKKYATELGNSTGSAKEMSDIVGDNLQGDMDKLDSAIEGVRLSMFSAFGGESRDAVSNTTELIGNLEPIAIATGKGIAILADSLAGWAWIAEKSLAIFFKVMAQMGLTEEWFKTQNPSSTEQIADALKGTGPFRIRKSERKSKQGTIFPDVRILGPATGAPDAPVASVTLPSVAPVPPPAAAVVPPPPATAGAPAAPWPQS
jgi:hypothetical protein